MLTEEQDVTGYLASKGIQTFRSAGTEVTAHCLWCLDGDPKGKGRLYINTESWLYKCFRCEAAGNRKTLLEFFGDEDGLKHVPGADPALRRRILTEVAEMAHEMLLRNDAKCQWLIDRGISGELIVEQQLGYVPKNVGISEMIPARQSVGYRDLIGAGVVTLGGKEFFSDAILIPYWSHGSVVELRARTEDPENKYKSTSAASTRLYNADALFSSTELLITEGEFDCLRVLREIRESNERSLQTLGVVGMPGAGVWPDGIVDMLSHTKKVYIGFDPDETGTKFAHKLAEEIGTKARIVELPPGLPKTDWSDFLNPKTPTNPNGGHDWRDLRDLLVEADLAGKRLFSVTDAAAKWKRQKNESPGIKLGWPALDSILRPGLKPGQVMIPLANTGTGKTVWLSNVAFNLRERHVLYISLEMMATEVFEHIRRIHRFHFPTAPMEQANADLANLRIVEQNRIGKGDLGDLIREYRDDLGHQPDVVIVDYLQYYARGFRGSSGHERANEAVMESKAVAKEEFTTLIIPSQVNRGTDRGKPLSIDDARDSGVIEETGDYVLGLFRPDLLQPAEGQLAPPPTGNFKAEILKSRHGGVGRIVDLRLSNMSLAIVDVLFDRKGAARVDQENSLARAGMHYDDYRARAEQDVAQRELRLVND